MIIFAPLKGTLNSLLSVQMAIAQGKEVVIATGDFRETLKRMSANFPGAVFEVKGNWGLKIWLKKAKPE